MYALVLLLLIIMAGMVKGSNDIWWNQNHSLFLLYNCELKFCFQYYFLLKYEVLYNQLLTVEYAFFSRRCKQYVHLK